MANALDQLVNRNVVRDHSPEVLNLVMRYLNGEILLVDFDVELSRMQKIERTALSYEERLWAFKEQTRRALELNPYLTAEEEHA